MKFIVALVLFLFSSNPAWALYCGKKIVSIGDSKYEVIAKCGEPDFIESKDLQKTQKVKVRVKPTAEFPNRRYVSEEKSIIIPIEEWTYDLGSNRLIQYLLFENGRLKQIKSGTYGVK